MNVVLRSLRIKKLKILFPPPSPPQINMTYAPAGRECCKAHGKLKAGGPAHIIQPFADGFQRDLLTNGWVLLPGDDSVR